MRASLCFLVFTIAHWTLVTNCEKSPIYDCDSEDGLDATSENGYCEAREGNRIVPLRHDCLRAAVVDYSRIDEPDCKLMIEANLDAYDEIAYLAKEDGARMIVFPEDGILMGVARNVFPCAEMIPDPIRLNEDYIPCLESSRFKQDLTILTRLSCLARKHELYVIANYGAKEEAGEEEEGESSDDGQYKMLNTDVVFDPTGRYIRRYRKWHPFTETEIFSKAPKLEHVYFDTDYGRFGVFTCFDILFKDPAIELVERYHIDTAIFPTWWFDELPLLTAVQMQDGWSISNQVNMLSSNILKPSRGSTGSSIFSGNNSVYVAANDYKSEKQVRKTKVLLGTIQTRHTGQSCQEEFNAKIFEMDTNTNYDKYKRKNYKLTESDGIKLLGGRLEGKETVCSGSVCCELEFRLSKPEANISDGERLIIFARDGPRQGFLQWYEQVCALATLKTPYKQDSNADSLDQLQFAEDAAVYFDKLILKASFNTRYVYPISAHNLSSLIDRKRRIFTCKYSTATLVDAETENEPAHLCEMEFIRDESMSNKIYSFGMYGRVHEKDKK